MGPTANDLDGYDTATVYPDGTVVRISVRRTGDEAYPSGWRYDNAHERTKGHERHVAPDPEPERIEFPGIEELYEQFWDEIPKPRFGPDTGDTHD